MSIILVTGASSGIGKATARKLLQQGHTVYVAARRVEAMQDLQAQGAIPLRMDITQEADVAAVVERIQKENGALDVLVNNAGYAIYGSVEETSIDDARAQFEVNLFGLARLTQLLIPAMRERGRGTIVNISSMGGKIYTPLGAWYHATKHAVEGWSDALRIELKAFGIDVVVIEPGIIATEFGDVMTQPMLDRSGHGPYGKLAHAIAGSKSPMSQPNVVADAIARAVQARRPKTRYVAGNLARPLMFVRKYFGDRVYDRLIMSQFR
ncbi:oxidoreductase [Pseudoxanthomonas winnipegensis]|uniref:SDR family NAD(P)-dependent oxidoreductase n=1 Tax=Pseudoxanthomonas winnipegensis TaxID=2480810 RepID=A0A4Q8LIX6_9GAMM|nr:oxidoreductase [Pseudoxanthomonas winnipegensis]RZZ87813.1 SDR family NAD(P)-dependent oxidoreductase [Pseudoxanthomonas winnipegensis]TAA29950.1 SDR family NAD(P)-dependent oxidoreductase [Pseudoxanthomonas winnipegensis]TBV78092.1 SDR family NAD(P)-dependent oxidoreductase [Pseudoxanthomonas winnipegensis]